MRLGKTPISNTIYFILWIFLVICSSHSIAQISPGDLSKAHAHLEGISNCTKCHVLGDKVSNDKCLDCHKEIKNRVDQQKGFHATAEVRGKDCFACHSDHHGREFDIVRFDEKSFNHQKTGFALTGAHQTVDCRQCHKSEWSDAEVVKKRPDTYLGLKTQCNACHKDVHQNTLSTNCASCHNTQAFEPASLFDHSKTDFPLKGEHRNVDCKSCHAVTVVNNQSFQKFSGIPFNTCATCHDDVHNARLGNQCNQCHTEESFQSFTGTNSFNHSKTDFALVGKHKKLNCTACHTVNANTTPANVFRDYEGKTYTNCTACHTDVHDQKFGNDCRKCHTEESFHQLANPGEFSHDMTGFALEGKHASVDCKNCHQASLLDPVPHARCADCHADFHKGQFINAKRQWDCADCHNTNGFTGSTFSVDMHNQSDFPLTGAHLATACIFCHQKNEEWVFKDMGHQCINCHKDVHENNLSEKYYPQKACTQCHVTDEWTSITFDHLQTGFALKGKHNRISCSQCHVAETNTGTQTIIPFTGLHQACNSCHEEVHGDQFEQEGITDCTRCHSFEAWQPSTFDHDSARFVLEGAHATVSCSSCHKEEIEYGKTIVIYRLENFACVDCHQ